MKPIKHKDLVKILKSKGCTLTRITASHEIWQVNNCTAVVPRHPHVAAGTVRSIQRQLAACLGEGWLQ